MVSLNSLGKTLWEHFYPLSIYNKHSYVAALVGCIMAMLHDKLSIDICNIAWTCEISSSLLLALFVHEVCHSF